MVPEEFVEAAERLLAESDKEADQRSAVSRAYYGALHASRISMPAPYIIPTTESIGSHKAVIDGLSAWGRAAVPGRSDARVASRALASMKHKRTAADYDIHEPVNTGAVTSCVAEARKIIKLVHDARALYDKQQPSKQA